MIPISTVYQKLFESFFEGYRTSADPDQSIRTGWSGSTLVANALKLIFLQQCSYNNLLTGSFSILSGDAESAQGEPYSANDITEALNETQNDSRADTTMDAEVTQDSVAM